LIRNAAGIFMLVTSAIAAAAAPPELAGQWQGKLAVKIASLQGTCSGTLSEKTLSGEWKQGNLTGPLVLTR
jgi:hypothetical protein